MSGHSKWSNIQHRKSAQDKKRSKLFSKLVKEITVATKIGGIDIQMNPRLRHAINTAKQNSLPKDVIHRAIKKYDIDSKKYYEVRYEGFTSNGIGIIVEAVTDNKNRTASSIRSIFNKSGYSVGIEGSVSFGFNKFGCISYFLNMIDEDLIINAVLDSGAYDYEIFKDKYFIYCNKLELYTIAKFLAIKFGESRLVNIIWKPKLIIDLNNETGIKIYNLISELKKNNDVEGVYSNLKL